jgi:polyisoprenoid-binding protein YceI
VSSLRPLILWGAVAAATLSGGALIAATWNVDSTHSSAVFRIKHQNVAYVYGRFNDISGTVDFDPDKPDASKLSISIQAESVDTGNDKRDDHLRSPDFFNAVQFETITFESKKWSGSGTTFEITGDLTMLGKTREITIELENTGIVDHPRGGKVAGWHSNFTIKRSDFGMMYGVEQGALGDEVELFISLETKSQ